MVKKKTKIVIVGVIVTVFLLTIGVSYALWKITLQQTDKNVITTGCFQVEFNDKNPIHLEKAYPISDAEGKSLVPYEFTITNTCESKASFQINLETLNTTTLSDLSVIKMYLNELEKEDAVKTLASHEVVSKTLENATNSYKIKTGFLKAKESKTFELKLWLDENTPTDEAYMNKTFESKVTVISSLIVDETPPEIIASTRKNELNSITVDASESFDKMSGIETYYFRLENENWNSSEEPIYTFSNLEYQEYTIEVQVEDFLGNKSEIKTLKEIPKVRATDYVNSLNGNGEVLNDGTVDNNVRYIGANPKNYIDIGDRDASGNIIPWRIIGSMNNIKTTEDGVGETRLKIIRAESIGEFSWDSSASNINSGLGVNEWSQADLMKLLNPGYESEAIGGSLYWNKQSGKCYNGRYDAMASCDFSESGLSLTVKNFIKDAIWNLGSNGSESVLNVLASNIYNLERSNNTGKIICNGGVGCNDAIARTTTWKGKIGLMYPSDFAYATGGQEANRNHCLSSTYYSLASTENCRTNNWLHNSSITQWTISPEAVDDWATCGFLVFSSNYINGIGVANDFSISPVLYLKTNVNIVSGNGELNTPYVASLD